MSFLVRFFKINNCKFRQVRSLVFFIVCNNFKLLGLCTLNIEGKEFAFNERGVLIKDKVTSKYCVIE